MNLLHRLFKLGPHTWHRTWDTDQRARYCSYSLLDESMTEHDRPAGPWTEHCFCGARRSGHSLNILLPPRSQVDLSM